MMSVAAEQPSDTTVRFDRSTALALLVLASGALCLIFEPYAPWISTFPQNWTLPVTNWVGAGLEHILGAIKPPMRFLAWLLSFPMDWVNIALRSLPAPIVIAAFTGLGWYAAGFRLAALCAIGLFFVLLSGYWPQSMNTLALVAVSVPVAAFAGGAIGILAHEVPRVRSALLACLDAMQTIPTFAYLTPLLLLFGFGPVVGVVASAIYAAPPMARNMLLGLERVSPEIREAGIMSGARRWQQIALIEIPASGQQIMIGVNQCLMASLSMIIIAAVIGGFDDIGWEVLLTMRKAQFGQALLAGLVIVVFALILDRTSAALAMPLERRKGWPIWMIAAIGCLFSLWGIQYGFSGQQEAYLAPFAEETDNRLTEFVRAYGASLDRIKNTITFYGLLPLRIGLDEAVLPFTWGFSWSPAMSHGFFAAAAILAALLASCGQMKTGALLLIMAGILETGISQLPWPFVLVATACLAIVANGARLAVLLCALLCLILLSGLWERALLSVYLSGSSVIVCIALGGLIGLLASSSTALWSIVRPICDMLQTIPLFVFLIPVLMIFQIGEFSAFLAICAYAIVPMIRYTREGLVSTPADLIEAATASGATNWQIMRDVRLPYAAPTILLGINQTILFAFAMLVIAALIGTTGLGQSIYLALGQADVGLGVSAGAAMAILAFIADRLLQGFADSKRRALGL